MVLSPVGALLAAGAFVDRLRQIHPFDGEPLPVEAVAVAVAGAALAIGLVVLRSRARGRSGEAGDGAGASGRPVLSLVSRREYLREAFGVPVAAIRLDPATSGRAGEPLSGTLLDLGGGGARLSIHPPPELGARMELLFALRPGDAPVRPRGQVVRTIGDGPSAEVAVAFDDVSVADRQRIVQRAYELQLRTVQPRDPAILAGPRK